jgi:hypothetical protein
MSFISCFRDISAEIQRDGIAAYDMRDQGHLESVFITGDGWERDGQRGRETTKLTWLEANSTSARAIIRATDPSRIRYFLDGSQRTLRAFFADNIPVVAGIIGAAIVTRDDVGELRLVEGMVAFKRIWVTPLDTSLPNLNRIISVLTSRDEQVLDPLDRLKDKGRYNEELQDFSAVLEHAFNRVGVERAKLEQSLLVKWSRWSERGDGVILVDGPLRDPVSDAIGLVKSFTRQYVSGAEAATLFRLRHNERTAAFTVKDAWREETPIKAWYQRQWDASGRDPRYGLIRLELFDGWSDHPPIDTIADWVMRERLPTAKNDARWATLLYPVHLLEEILKGQLDGETRGWSALA